MVTMFRKQMMSSVCAAAILCGGEGVSAQTISKRIDANGHTVFTDRAADAGIVVPYPTISSQERGSVPPHPIANGTQSYLAKALSGSSAKTLIDAATIDFNEAARRLRQARRDREEGRELWRGERADSAGVSAMNKRYQRRQRNLEQEVVAAELRANEAALIRSTLLERYDKLHPSKLTQR